VVEVVAGIEYVAHSGEGVDEEAEVGERLATLTLVLSMQTLIGEI
jgi:hypothetical protein